MYTYIFLIYGRTFMRMNYVSAIIIFRIWSIFKNNKIIAFTDRVASSRIFIIKNNVIKCELLIRLNLIIKKIIVEGKRYLHFMILS